MPKSWANLVEVASENGIRLERNDKFLVKRL
jgi:hypothetical protein